MNHIGVEGEHVCVASKMQASKSDMQGHALVTFVCH